MGKDWTKDQLDREHDPCPFYYSDQLVGEDVVVGMRTGKANEQRHPKLLSFWCSLAYFISPSSTIKNIYMSKRVYL